MNLRLLGVIQRGMFTWLKLEIRKYNEGKDRILENLTDLRLGKIKVDQVIGKGVNWISVVSGLFGPVYMERTSAGGFERAFRASRKILVHTSIVENVNNNVRKSSIIYKSTIERAY
jgi:hypothetical protein